MTNPLVSICCITYNHAPYIAQAIEGFLMQQTPFAVEIVIHDDASTDGTSDILRQYATRYPDKIRATIHPVNKGMMPNFIGCLQACRGEYIALCEGDDYWTDAGKLERQISYLQQYPDTVLCFTNGWILEEDTLQPHTAPVNLLSVQQLLQGNKYLTTTAAFKRQAAMPLPAGFEKLPFGDFGLYIWLLRNPLTRAAVLPLETAVYRRHAGGVHSALHLSQAGRQQVWQHHVAFYKQIQAWLRTPYAHEIETALNQVATYLGISRPVQPAAKGNKYAHWLKKKLLGRP